MCVCVRVCVLTHTLASRQAREVAEALRLSEAMQAAADEEQATAQAEQKRRHKVPANLCRASSLLSLLSYPLLSLCVYLCLSL